MKFSQISQALCGATLVAALPGLDKNALPARGLTVRANNGTPSPLMALEGMENMVVPFEVAVQKFANAPKAESDPATYNDKASPLPPVVGSCKNPSVRVEWSNYSPTDRNALMGAFKCLLNRPSAKVFPQATNRYEDFVALHQAYRYIAHDNQIFFPWHRYLIWAFEQALRNECQFTGPLFWFDEVKHAGAYEKSDLFTSEYLGILRNNVNYNVPDGVFANLTLYVGRGNDNYPHLLNRMGSPEYSSMTGAHYVNMCLRLNDYKNFEKCFEPGPHGAGHVAVGGVMNDIFASPGDPFFWFHHIFVDRAWEIWQQADPVHRYTSIDGTDFYGNPVTLKTVLSLAGIQPNVTIGQVINPRSGSPLCYRYDY
ncbi:hypothetical protein F4861DRAFT_270582 [Xylaria intraflava]|nr:hypothetical protein F4861DRAFT_270582 [Xylaria intraflava]